jgi:flagellar basal-body rod protein FlgC
MSSFSIFDISGSALSAQSVRLNAVASNLANADSVAGKPEDVYRARTPVFRIAPEFSSDATPGVRVSEIQESEEAPQQRYEPGNPLADEQGYVYAPNVNVVEQMVDMISASRSFQGNVDVMNTAKELTLATLTLGK